MIGQRDYFVIGCLPLGVSPGFALPILSTPGHPNNRSIQEVDEYTGQISNFLDLHEFSNEILPALDALRLRIGDHSVLAFVSDDGTPHFGTPSQLEPILRYFVSRFPDENSVRLQIAELIGTSSEKRNARLAMREALAKSCGLSPAKAFYEGSVLRSALWTNLLAAAPTRDIVNEILSVRSRLGGSISPDGNLNLNLEVLSKRTRRIIDETKIRNSILAEFAVTADMLGDELTQAPNLEQIQMGRVSELLSRIRSEGRQEDRLAILIDGILENKPVGASALLQYRGDKAKFANSVLPLISENLIQNENDDRRLQLSAARLFSDLYSRQYPASRGSFLLAFAKHLGRWPIVNNEIRNRLNRSNSIFIAPIRRQIEEVLDTPKARRSAVSDLPLFKET